MEIITVVLVVALLLAIVSLFVDARLNTVAVILVCGALLVGALK